MFSQKNRLRRRRDISQVFRSGRRVVTSFFVGHVFRTALPHSRFTVVVSTKVLKLATKRNRAKRVVREALRLRQDKFPKGYDVVVAVKRVPEPPTLTWAEEAVSELEVKVKHL